MNINIVYREEPHEGKNPMTAVLRPVPWPGGDGDRHYRGASHGPRITSRCPIRTRARTLNCTATLRTFAERKQ